MGILGKIAKSYKEWKKGPVRKHAAEMLYKRRDIKLDKAIKEGKVTSKQKTALGKGGTKKYRKKFGPKKGLAREVERQGTISDILKDIRGG